MPLPLLAAQGIMSGIGLLGGILGNRGQQQRSSQRSTNQQNTNFNTYNRGFSTSTTNPLHDELQWNTRNEMLGAATRGLNVPQLNPAQMARSATTQRMWNAGTSGDILRKQLQQAYAGQGINYGALGAAPEMQAQSNVVQQRVQALNEMPFLEEQFRDINFNRQQSALQQLISAYASTPKGQESSQDTYNHQTQLGETTGLNNSEMIGQIPGNMAGGGLMGLGQGLGSMFGTMYANQWNPYGQSQSQGNPMTTWQPSNTPNLARLMWPGSSFNPYLLNYDNFGGRP